MGVAGTYLPAVQSYLGDGPLYQFMVYYIPVAVLVGTYQMYKAVQFVKTIIKKFTKPPSFMAKYGQSDSWVVITGGAAGAGSVFAKKMADEGFNVCFIGSNEKEMHESCRALTQSVSTINTRCVVADFAKMKSLKEYYTAITPNVADLDVAILFVKAGHNSSSDVKCAPKLMREQTNAEVEYDTRVHLMSVVYTHRCLYDQLVKRSREHKRSAVVITGSAEAVGVVPGKGQWCGGVMTGLYLCLGCHYEEEEDMDHISFNPALEEGPDAQKGLEDSCHALLRDLGNGQKFSLGSAAHEGKYLAALGAKKVISYAKFRNYQLDQQDTTYVLQPSPAPGSKKGQ